MKLLFLIILIPFLLLINITYTLYSQKSEIDNFEYIQELCEPNYWFYIFDNYFLDSNKVKIKCLNIDSIDNFNITNFQYFKSKKDKFYKDYDGNNLRNLSLVEEYFDFIFDKIYTNYHICEEFKRKYKYLTKDRFKEAIQNSYYNYLKYGNYNYDQILDSINNIFIEVNKYEDSFILLDTINGFYIPKDVEDAIIYLNNTIDSNSIADFKNLPEDKAVGIEHLGIGMWLRNNFRLWGKSRLQQYFERYKIRHPDHMSSIILTAWHRSLNNKEINLNLIMSARRKYEKYDE